jgi:hypothetical protein
LADHFTISKEIIYKMATTSMTARIEAFGPLFAASFERSCGLREADQQKDIDNRKEILKLILNRIQEIEDGFQIIGQSIDDCDEHGPVINYTCENDYSGEMWQINNAISYNIAGAFITMCNNGFNIRGQLYFIDTNNDLIFRLLCGGCKKITIDDITLITQDEKVARYKWSSECRNILEQYGNDERHKGFLTVGSYYHDGDKWYTPIDAGIAANLLKCFNYDQTKIRISEKYKLDTTICRISKMKIDGQMHPKITSVIIWLLRSYPVQFSYIQHYYDQEKTTHVKKQILFNV